ncbi:hypothetical protein [Sphingomonas sp.]|jgi:hypothetical protein|uniref:hypothetical protein n=1 Tax=Sphingomonas sp. TaxID=28214 RepID=UPI002ED7BD70
MLINVKHEANIAKPVTGMSEDELTDWLCALPPPPETGEDDLAESIARARTDMAAGRWYTHELVGEWLKTAGSAEFLPIEEWLACKND